MMIALIHWRIKPDPESKSEFIKHWKENNTIGDRTGLIGEFLSNTLPMAAFPFITWHLDPESLGDFQSYVTIGIWAETKDFQSQVAGYFNDSSPMLGFEKYRRRRVIFEPVEHRIGRSPFPKDDSAGVK